MIVLFTLLACGPKTPDAADPMALVTDEAAREDLDEAATQEVEALAAEAHAEAQAEMAEAPYTPEQIRDTFVLGLVIRWETTRHAEGVTLHSEWEVTEWSEEHATNTSWELDGDGARVGEGESGAATWEELQSHAIFPAMYTKTETIDIDSPLGTLPGRRYTVLRDPDKGRVDVFEFADDLPGPPVRMQSFVGETPVYTMVQVARIAP